MTFNHQEIKILPYPKDFLYSLIADVENYPNFIPWISSVTLLNSTQDSEENSVKEYELCVDFKVIKEKFSTRDVFCYTDWIHITLLQGPFKYLQNHWTFESLSPSSTKITFDIEFEFKSRLFTSVFAKVFIHAQKRILQAFENQAKKTNIK